MVVTRRAEVIAPTVRTIYVAVELCGSATDNVGQMMTVGVYKLILCEFVLEFGESGFNARIADQTLVARLVAGMVG